MQQRQLRLGDILDDYCPRERRLTNHAVVAMVGPDVKQTRCTTCDTEHQYKHAKVPRQRRKSETPAALYSQVLAGGPKRVVHEPGPDAAGTDSAAAPDGVGPASPEGGQASFSSDASQEKNVAPQASDVQPAEAEEEVNLEEGPVHRPLIRATLPRPEGQAPTRPAPEFTLRRAQGRHGRFPPRPHHGPTLFHGNRSGNVPGGGGMPRKRHGPGRRRSK